MDNILHPRRFIVAWILVAAGIAAHSQAAPLRLRRPVALCFSADSRFVHVANRASGTISTLDASLRRCVGEAKIGQRLSAAIVVRPGLLAVTDEMLHCVHWVQVSGADVRVVSRSAAPRYPVSLTLLDAGARERPAEVVVSGLWSRRIARVVMPAEGDATKPLDPEHVIDMPWAPRCLLPLPDGNTMVVGDAFGGRLGIVDRTRWRLSYVREFPAHNIRGLALSRNGEKLVIAHQMLNDLAQTVRNDVHWGLLMSNDLRYMPIKTLLQPDGDIYQFAHMHPLGEAGNATSDPAGLSLAPDGAAVVTLGGVGEVAIGREDEFSLKRLKVGRRPTGVAVSTDGQLAATANTLDDSVTLINLPDREALATISLGQQPELSLAQRGELLFYDGALSHDRWMSCHSCHPDGHTNGQRNDNLSDFKTFGAPKRVLSLLGKRGTAPFAWNGSAQDLETQIFNSIESTMQSDDAPRAEDIQAIAAFLRTLEPPPSLDAARESLDQAAVARGRQLFKRQGCQECHAAPSFTTPDVYDVGMEDELHHRRFNPPSLRGVGQRGPYFHDGRAKQLRAVFEAHRHQLDKALTEAELSDLLAFLRSL